MAMMQHNATELINVFEAHKIMTKYELDRVKFEMKGMRQYRSAHSAMGSVRSDSMAATSVHEGHTSARRSLATTPVAPRPRDTEPHLWDTLHRNKDHHAARAEEQGVRGVSPRAGGHPGVGEFQWHYQPMEIDRRRAACPPIATC